MPSFPGQQNRMTIIACRFRVSEDDHRSSHEDRASSCLHIKPSSVGFILFHHLNIPIAYYQKVQQFKSWFRVSASLQKCTLPDTWRVEWVSNSQSNAVTDTGLSTEERVDVCCYWVRLLHRCGEYNDVSKTPHSKNNTRLNSWRHLAFRNEHGEELWEADWNYLCNLQPSSAKKIHKATR